MTPSELRMLVTVMGNRQVVRCVLDSPVLLVIRAVS